MATYTNQTKSSTSFSNENINLTRLDLLIGDGFKLLIESPFTLDIDVTPGASFVNQNKNTDTFNNQTKN